MGLIFHCHPSRSSLQQVQFLPAFRTRASYADFIIILFFTVHLSPAYHQLPLQCNVHLNIGSKNIEYLYSESHGIE